MEHVCLVRGTNLRRGLEDLHHRGTACEKHRTRRAMGREGCVKCSSRKVVVVDQNANGDETKHGELKMISVSD
jgi:hypothetical protein